MTKTFTTTDITKDPKKMSPRIGQLCRKGQTVYYAYLDGQLYVEATDWRELQAYIECEERDGSTYRAGIKDA